MIHQQFPSQLSDFEVMDTKKGLFKCNIKLSDAIKISEFVNNQLYHNITANRYLHRYFLCNRTSRNFEDVATILAHQVSDDSTWILRMQTFPKFDGKLGNHLMEHCHKKVTRSHFFLMISRTSTILN
jgi:hypothetical protein